MQNDAPPTRLPLAEALIAWSDPQLIASIQQETCKVDAKLLERMDRYTLATIVTERRRPRRGRTLSLGPVGLGDFDRAWDRLLNQFRLKVERGEVALQGVDSVSSTDPRSIPIPRELAADMDFDPAAGAIFIGIHTYTNVTAIRAAVCEYTPVGGTLRNPNTETIPTVLGISRQETGATKPSGRGRASYEGLIRETMHERWPEIERAVDGGNSWTAIAGWMHKHLEKKYPGDAHLKKLPTVETIRTRIAKWYPEELARRTVR